MVDDGTAAMRSLGTHLQRHDPRAAGRLADCFSYPGRRYSGRHQSVPDRALTKVFPNDSPTRECLVRFGELQPPGSFGAYHMWITRDTAIRWGPIIPPPYRRDQLSNAGLDGTFVYITPVSSITCRHTTREARGTSARCRADQCQPRRFLL